MARKASGWFPEVELDAPERRRMLRVTKSLRTKADKIRALSAAGYSKQQVASFLGIRYQHVRNVLVRSEPNYRASPPPPGPSGLAEPAKRAGSEWIAGEPDEAPTYGAFVVDEQGRITLPRKVIVALDAGSGRAIPWRFEDGELKLMNREAGIRFAQAMVAKKKKKKKKRHPGSWSDALIAERRAEAAREDERYERWRRG